MKPIFLISIIFILFLSCNSDSINDKSKRTEYWAWWIDAKTGEGKWIPTRGNNQIQDKGSYILFYPNGKIFEKGKMEKGKNIDTVFNYDINGAFIAYHVTPDSTLHYVKDGLVTRYYHNGQIHESGIIKNLDYGDKWTVYFKSGGIKRTWNLNDGKGWDISYFKNGNQKDSIYILSKDSSVVKKEYFEDGKLKLESNLKNGRYDGICRTYYENGNVKQEIDKYIKGVPNGILKYFYEDGKLELNFRAINGINTGKGYIWYESGAVKGVIDFLGGDSSKIVGYYEDGKPKFEGELLIDNVDSPLKWDDGLKLKLNGEIKYYNENGRFVQRTYWKDGAIVKSEKVP